jgi:hypothetical protein
MSYIFQVPDEIYTEIASYAAQRGQTPDALLLELVIEGLRHLKYAEPTYKAAYDPNQDPLAPFIGAFDSGDDDAGWIERHDAYFAGNDGQE